MKNYSVKQYTTVDYSVWNSFLSNSKNGTFLLHRDFMEYHCDAFSDCSFLIFEETKLIAILPANRTKSELYSHQGLTYGGLLYSKNSSFESIFNATNTLFIHLKQIGISSFYIKNIPSIYCKFPSNEIDYILFLSKAILVSKEVLLAVNLKTHVVFTKGKQEGVLKGTKNNLIVVEEPNFELFWEQILVPNLQLKHKTKPTHSWQEMEYLHKKFPKKIRQFNVYYNNKIVGGTTIFETEMVAHTQYISGNESKNTLGTLDFLFHYLIKNVFSAKSFFSFGTSSCSDSARNINHGLHFWKQGFGTTVYLQEMYRLDLDNFSMD